MGTDRRMLLATAISWLLGLTIVASGLPTAQAVDTHAGEQGLWAVSVREILPIANSPEAKRLFGTTYLRGFCVFEDQHGLNLALLVMKEPNRPALRLDDFVVAWRNVSTSTDEPGCTIDPTSESLRQLEAVNKQIDAEERVDRTEALLERWKRLAGAPQTVRIFGVPPNTHFARVMVEADYLMKDFCQGHRVLATVPSTFEMFLAQSRQAMETGARERSPARIMSRFWFTADNPAVYQQQEVDLVLLGKLPIVLRTEAQMLGLGGGLVDRGRVHAIDQQFALAFTERFDHIARDWPIFRELENLYRAVAIAKILWQLKQPEIHNLLDELVRRTNLDRPSVPKTLPGKYRVESLSVGRDLPGGRLEVRSWVMLWGGVKVNVSITPRSVVNVPAQVFQKVRERVVVAQPHVRAPCWFCSPQDPLPALP